MGLFKHKEKRPDLEPTSGPAKNLPPNPNPPPVQNSFNDSTYYSGSDVSRPDPQKAAQNQQKAQGKPPGTTVTTTTTSKIPSGILYFYQLLTSESNSYHHNYCSDRRWRYANGKPPIQPIDRSTSSTIPDHISKCNFTNECT